MTRFLPRQRAVVTTFASSIWIQLLTVVSGILSARLLQPEGRGLLAGVMIWPAVFGSIALLGINHALAIRAAQQPSLVGKLTRAALFFGIVSSLVVVIAGWYLLPWLAPRDPAGALSLNRLNLLYIPLFVLTAHLLAIDQGSGNFRRFNIARNVLNPVYLLAVLLFWILDVRLVLWFVVAQLVANFAVLIYRLMATSPIDWSDSGDSLEQKTLLRTGIPFWLAGIAYIIRDNVDRALLLFLLGTAPLGLYVVALTAAGVHLTFSKSFNFVIFARSAALSNEEAMKDAARFFRVTLLVNLALGIGLAAVLPWLIPILFGTAFSAAIIPAILLVVSQTLLAQGSLLEESLRAQRKPLLGVMGMAVTIAIFALAGIVLAPRSGVVGVAIAAIIAQFSFCLFMSTMLKRFHPGARLLPGGEDVRFIVANATHLREAILKRFSRSSGVA